MATIRYTLLKQESLPNESPRIPVKCLTDQIIIHHPVEFCVSWKIFFRMLSCVHFCSNIPMMVLVENPFADPKHTVHVEILTDETSPFVEKILLSIIVRFIQQN